jgi:16S rRNA (uracil1498-N3)-methyltransferase
MHRVFASQVENGLVQPDSEESGHLVRVLRLRDGDTFEAVDGKGGLFLCRLEKEGKHDMVGHVLSQTSIERPSPGLTLVMAPTKNADRTEWLLEKATELGIHRFVPLLCQRSERKQIRTDRLFRIAVSAMKQSQRLWLPDIQNLCTLPDFLKECGTDEKWIAHCTEGPKELMPADFGKKDTIVMIGPEGDFSESEIRMAEAAGFKGLSLGETRLRTDTAALKVCALFNR